MKIPKPFKYMLIAIGLAVFAFMIFSIATVGPALERLG